MSETPPVPTNPVAHPLMRREDAGSYLSADSATMFRLTPVLHRVELFGGAQERYFTPCMKLYKDWLGGKPALVPNARGFSLDPEVQSMAQNLFTALQGRLRDTATRETAAGPAITVPDLSALLRIGQQTVRDWVRSGVLPVETIPGGRGRPMSVVTADTLQNGLQLKGPHDEQEATAKHPLMTPLDAQRALRIRRDDMVGLTRMLHRVGTPDPNPATGPRYLRPYIEAMLQSGVAYDRFGYSSLATIHAFTAYTQHVQQSCREASAGHSGVPFQSIHGLLNVPMQDSYEWARRGALMLRDKCIPLGALSIVFPLLEPDNMECL